MFKSFLVLTALVLGGVLYNTNKTDYIPDVYSSIVTIDDIGEVEQLTPTLGFKNDVKLSNVSKNKLITLEKGNTVIFRGEVNGQTVAKAQTEILNLVRSVPANKPIFLVLDTPGGSVFAGLDFIDFIKGLGRKIHTITIFAASMGFQFVQNLDNRYISPNGVLMSHRASGGVKGQFDGEIEQRYKLIKNVIDRLDAIASKRLNLGVKEYKELIKDEFWVNGFNSLKSSSADEIVLLKCGESLQGTSTQIVRTFFGSANVRVSNCPLIRGILSADINSVNFGFSKAEATELLDTLYGQPKKYLVDFMLADERYSIFSEF